MPESTPWKVSLHGGHSGTYCDHAVGTLREVLEAAAEFGYQTFGVTEHAPRPHERYLYDEERALGWDLDTLHRKFDDYARDLAELSQEFEGRLVVLRGFETEAVPKESYADTMLALREKYRFEYIAGSVHHVFDTTIDGPPPLYAKAVEIAGSVERLAIAYYSDLAEMVRALRPEIVTHFDLVRRNAPTPESVETPAVRESALAALDVVRAHNGILDLNTAGIRKGLGCPYPRPWLVREAHARGIPFCFGDDSHGPAQVGKDIGLARDYLVANGVDSITLLTREHGRVVRKNVPLNP